MVEGGGLVLVCVRAKCVGMNGGRGGFRVKHGRRVRRSATSRGARPLQACSFFPVHEPAPSVAVLIWEQEYY